ncbi:MAG: ParB/RepB/Spo0J family partition protein [Pirellulaceae bacterium]|nr:ParB/RepB/Spo0J family partition protein [Pirellulaceae bacterium]
MSKERRLGRGLAALLGTPLEADVAEGTLTRSDREGHTPTRSVSEGESLAYKPEAQARGLDDSALANTASTPLLANQSTPDTGGLLQLPVGEIEENPFQPRRDFSDAEIVSLAESLKEHDMLQPILVRRVHGRFQLISGERRLRAARHAGWTTIPARIREADDRLVAELAIVENLQRKDLNPVEKALSFKRYVDEHRCTQDDLARRLKIDRSTIANLMRLLELPPSILDGLRKGAITAGHARALLPLGDEHEQVAFARRIESEGLSVRDIERLVATKLGDDQPSAEILPGPGKRKRTTSEQIASLEQEFRHALGTKVEIKANARGRGKLIIHFADHDAFDHLREHLTGTAPPTTKRKSA